MSENNQSNQPQDQSEDGPSLTAHLRPRAIPSALVRLDLAAQSHTGFVRKNNEDHYLAVRMSRSLETILTNLPETDLPRRFSETAFGMLVADGMGGLAAGEVASRIALMKLLELVVQTPDWFMKMDEPQSAGVVMRRMTTRFRAIDDELRELGESKSSLLGMGTTLTVAASLGADLFIGHIGDSRAYLRRGRQFHQLTKDHTLAQVLLDSGLTTPDDPSTKTMRNVLTAALGTTGERSDPQVQRIRLSDGDQLLLCSDGLTDMVSDDNIASVLGSATSSATACQELIDLALAAGGNDNVTAIVAGYRF